MNPKLVFRVIAFLLLTVAALMLAPVVVAWYYDESEMIRHFLVPIGVVVAGASGFLILTKGGHSELSTRDGFFLVAASWALVSLLGAVPLYTSGAIPRFVDAFFETMSGFTTTGASVLTDIESLPRAMLFWRSLTHWLGGMGIIVLTVAIFPILGIGGLQLLKAEAPGPTVDKITPKVTETAKILWLTYFALTAAETILLLLGGMDLFDSLTHTFGTLATGGFSPKNTSVGFYSSPFIHIVITAFMVMAGINFVMYYKLLTGRPMAMLRDTELKAYLAIFAGGSLVVALGLHAAGTYDSLGTSLRFGAFQAASILTTTGYVTADYATWPAVSQAMLFILMFVGGCAGSTGGGIKVVRVVTLVKQGFIEMRYLLHPRGVFGVKLNGETVHRNIVYAIAGFVFLYVTVLLVTTFVVASGGYGLLSSFATALATLGNIGPGFGLVGPAENYGFYQDYIKWFLSFVMMLGRLEVFTVLIVFTPFFWRR
ncbi:MAG: TrkH family potassium uptake protein [Spirochaetaceae bacterium]